MGVKYIPNTVRLFLIFLHVERKFNAPPFTSLYFLSPLLRTGGFQRHEDHDNWIERGHHLSIPSVRRERRLGVGRKVGIRGHHRDHGCQRAKFGEQREDYEREEFRIEHKLGRADNRNRRGQRSGGKIRRSGRIRNYSVIYHFLSFDRPMDMEIFRSEVLSTLRRRHQRNRHPNLGTVGDVQGPETIHGLRDTGSGENYARLGRVHTGRVQEDASRYGIR